MVTKLKQAGTKWTYLNPNSKFGCKQMLERQKFFFWIRMAKRIGNVNEE